MLLSYPFKLEHLQGFGSENKPTSPFFTAEVTVTERGATQSRSCFLFPFRGTLTPGILRDQGGEGGGPALEQGLGVQGEAAPTGQCLSA